MVRESRHLWVGNLPENVREDEIRDYFSRYGKVEKVKLLIKTSPDGAKAAFVDFVDIRAAVKANESQNRIGERDLRTNFNEPGANKHKYNLHGYPPGVDYRQPVVIYAAPPSTDFLPAYGRQVYPQNDRRFSTPQTYTYRPRGRSPSSRGYSSDDRSPSPRRRGGYSSDSDNSSGRTYSVLVRHIGPRISDSSLEEALYHEFKKEGEIMNIKIGGSGSDRYAYVQFSSFDEAERACLHTGKSFHGDNLKVKIVRKERKRESNLDDLPFDPHSTRTIFVGNVEKTLMHGELKSIFEKFGDVVEVDIKKMQTGIVTYAFVQYIDINGSMLAKLKMDREYIGHTKIKVGFGRGTPTNSLWVGNLPKDVTESQLTKLFQQFGYVQRCLIDKYLWQALVRFETIESCTRAFADMHGKPIVGKRLAVDYASPACRDGFYSRMERKGLLDRRQLEPSPTPPDVHMNFTNAARGGAFQPRGHMTDVQPIAYTAAPTPAYPPKDYRDDRDMDRYGSEKPKSNFDYDKELRDFGYGRRDKRDYSPMSRSSSSPPRRRYSRDSISPVSSIGERRLKSKIEKQKKRKLSVDSPLPLADQPLSKKEKKKMKKEKKEKMKSMKTKGTLDFGYDYDEDGQYQELKSKAEMKKEKKARKKAEKARKKAEKKQKRLEKLKADENTLIEQQVATEETKEEEKVDPSNPIKEENGEKEAVAAEITDISSQDSQTPEQRLDEEKKIDTETKTSDEEQQNNSGDKLEVGELASPQSPEPEKKQSEPEKLPTLTKKRLSGKRDDSSDSSSSSSSDSDDSDDSSDGDDDDRDYKHRSYKEREAMARKETERREPKAYRQDRDSSYDRRERNRDKTGERSRNLSRDGSQDLYRSRDFSRSRYPDRRSPLSYSARQNKSPSSDQSRSPSFKRSRSRSPYSKRTESPYDKNKDSPSRKSYSKKETTRSRRESTPPPPPPLSDGSSRKSEKSKYSSSSSSNNAGSGQSADTLLDLLRRFPVLWQGLLGLKNDTAAVQMHFLSGNIKLAEGSLPRSAQANEVPPTLRISQRMKLEPSQLEGVDKKILQSKDHCMLLALPCGRDPLDVHAQTRALKTGFLTYLQQKQAAGIVNISQENKNFVVHIFPPCDFSQGHVAKIAPDLLHSAADSGYLMILITPS